MDHYICAGECGGVSDKPGVCQAAVCSKAGEPLVKCEDGQCAHDLPPEESAEKSNE